MQLICQQDILLITSSTIFFGSSITALQIVGKYQDEMGTQIVHLSIFPGYAIALSGLLVFKLGGGK